MLQSAVRRVASSAIASSSSSSSSSASSPLRLAIIGSGPSGFYSAARVLSATKNEQFRDVQVHMYERLPVPNGLVRFGVAPDHLDVKNVEHKFAEVAQDPRFTFFGNVNVVGSSEGPSTEESREVKGYTFPHAVRLPLSILAQHYTHLLLSYGCSESRLLDIPGSQPGELRNVHSALDFVNWYNGHPAAHDPEFLEAEPWRDINLTGLKDMSVIGAGNVALDVARIVLRASDGSLQGRDLSGGSEARKGLAESDVPESVLQNLSDSRVTRVHINARRGPAQVAFTNKELREMMSLPGVAFADVDPHILQQARDTQAEEERLAKAADGSSQIDPETVSANASQARVKKRLLDLLAKGSKTKEGDADKTWALNFFRAPNAFEGSSKVEKIQWTPTSLTPGSSILAPTPAPSAGATTAAPWGNELNGTSDQQGAAAAASESQISVEKQTRSNFSTETDLVVSSVGYKGAALAGVGHNQASRTGQGRLILPWNAAKGVIPNVDGRVIDNTSGGPLPGLYVSGWLARGPVGVIASTMHDAYYVADLILADWSAGDQAPVSSLVDGGHIMPLSPPTIDDGMLKGLDSSLLRDAAGKRVVSWQDWSRLDAEEKRRGQERGKAREKFLSVKEMLNFVG